mmetsp:Transcript_34058/g.71512  ORF Transcript_34058/g.71512 Transcript_34058/m.71512 type:complete len:281 (-) Transcript_34058:61-903(-)
MRMSTLKWAEFAFQWLWKEQKNLPAMDVGRGADIFCVIFLENATGLFQTEVRRGRRESDWRWEEKLSNNFKWDLPNDSQHLYPSRKIVIMIYDKDQISEDDLVGCVTVSLGELKDGVFDSWKKITRPPKSSSPAFWKSANQGELKLKVHCKDCNQVAVKRDSNASDSNLSSRKPSDTLVHGSDLALSIAQSSFDLERGSPAIGMVVKSSKHVNGLANHNDIQSGQPWISKSVKPLTTTVQHTTPAHPVVEASNAAPLAIALLQDDDNWNREVTASDIVFA